jgi:hypothetical protein
MGFSLANYRDVLRVAALEDPARLDDENFMPSSGELLGPVHLAHAWLDLERGYATSLSMPSKRKALGGALAKLLLQKTSSFDESAPKGLRGQAAVLQLKPFYPDGADEAEQQRQETLIQIANACCWFAWYCRLETRQDGSLARFHSYLTALRQRIEVPSNGVNDCIAYYLHVAPAMFAYYLLLWELVLTVELDPIIQNV